jgi:hypothetical protein
MYVALRGVKYLFTALEVSAGQLKCIMEKLCERNATYPSLKL